MFGSYRLIGVIVTVFVLVASVMLLKNRDGSDPDSVTITILGEDSSNLRAIAGLEKEYEATHNVDLKFVAEEFGQVLEKSNRDFANHSRLYDIVLQYNFALSHFVRNNYVYTLNELEVLAPSLAQEEFKSDLYEEPWQEVGFYYSDASNPASGSVAVGYPFAANSMLLAYNQSMFSNIDNKNRFKDQFGRELAPPKSWEELLYIAKFFTDDSRDTKGIALQGANGGWLYYEWCNVLFGMGGKVMEKNRGWAGNLSTQVTLDTDASIMAADFYLSLKPFNAGDYFSTGAAEQREIMLNGNVAMAIMWSDYLYELVEKGKIKNLIFGFEPIPGSVSMLAGGAYYVNRDSDNPKEAAEFIAYVMQPEVQARLIFQGLNSGVKSSYDSVNPNEIPYISALRKSLERGVYMLEAGPDADAIQMIITEELQKAWRGGQTGVEAMHKAQQRIETERERIWKQIN